MRTIYGHRSTGRMTGPIEVGQFRARRHPLRLPSTGEVCKSLELRDRRRCSRGSTCLGTHRVGLTENQLHLDYASCLRTAAFKVSGLNYAERLAAIENVRLCSCDFHFSSCPRSLGVLWRAGFLSCISSVSSQAWSGVCSYVRRYYCACLDSGIAADRSAWQKSACDGHCQ